MVLLREQQAARQQPPRQKSGLLGMVLALLVVVVGVVLLVRAVRLPNTTTTNTVNTRPANINGILINAKLDVIAPQIASEIRGKLDKGDFAVLVTPALRSLKPGEKTSFTIRTVRAEGSPEEFALELTGLPKGATAALSATMLKSETETSTAVVNVPSTVALGKYEVTVSAKAGTQMRSAPAILTVSDLAADKVAAGDVRKMDAGTKWQASVTWKTDAPANTWVEYATEQSFIAENQRYTFTANDTSNNTDHTVTLSYLEPGITYHYRIRSVDKLGNTVVSDDQAFVTQ